MLEARTDDTGTWVHFKTRAGKEFAFRPRILIRMLRNQKAIAILKDWLEEQKLEHDLGKIDPRKNFFDEIFRGKL